MKLDVDVLRYLSKDDFRVLTAVEMGMRNHAIVPSDLIHRIASLKHGGTYKVLKNLLKHKLVHHDSSKYDGFRLTYLGYDFLAIKALVNRGVFTAVGRQIGVGKESDVFEVSTEDGTILAMKLHRLGRISFRDVKNKRDYLRHRSSYNWLYLSRLAALKEFAFMKALQDHGFPVPDAIDCNRHCVVMSLVQGYPLVQVRQLQNPDTVYETIIDLVVRLAEHGLIHCDFNEFNIMIRDDEEVTMIDFPQMVSVSHRNAEMYFNRDVACILKFFEKRFKLSFQEMPCFSAVRKDVGCLDKELAASGFTREDQDDIKKFIEEDCEKNSDKDDDDDTDDEQSISNEISETVSEDFSSLCILDKSARQTENEHGQKKEAGIENEDNDGRLSSDPEGCSRKVIPAEHKSNLEKQLSNGRRKNSEEDASSEQEEVDPELVKRLSKQRRKVIRAARRDGKAHGSRNSYKDKGGKSSCNSKVQKQLCNW